MSELICELDFNSFAESNNYFPNLRTFFEINFLRMFIRIDRNKSLSNTCGHFFEFHEIIDNFVFPRTFKE